MVCVIHLPLAEICRNVKKGMVDEIRMLLSLVISVRPSLAISYSSVKENTQISIWAILFGSDAADYRTYAIRT